MSKVFERKADGVKVTCYADGYPPHFVIEDEKGNKLSLFGRERAEGLHYALTKVLESLEGK